MQTRQLPGTELSLSVLGFGCWAMGGKYWGDDVTDDASTAAVHAALDEGINWFDTAPLYGDGHADDVLVKALGDRKRDVIIATKVGVRLGGEGSHARSDLTPAWVIDDTEASLRRLGLETIDLLQVHWPCDSGTPLEDTLATLEQLRSQGKIRYFGLCNYDAADVRVAAASPGMVSLQTPYSLLRREFEGQLREAVCSPRELGMLAYEPLCRGLLTGKYQGETVFPSSDMRSWDDRFSGPRLHHALALVRDLQRVADRLNVPCSAVAVAWVIAQPSVTAAITGAKTADQIRQNAQAARVALRPKVIKVVDQIASIHGGW